VGYAVPQHLGVLASLLADLETIRTPRSINSSGYFLDVGITLILSRVQSLPQARGGSA